MDRLITIHVDYFDRETEVAIAAARSGVSARRRGPRGRSGAAFPRAARRPASAEPPRGDHDRPRRRPAGRDVRLRPTSIFQRTYRDVLGLDRVDSHGTAEPRSHDVMETELADACELVETALQESV